MPVRLVNLLCIHFNSRLCITHCPLPQLPFLCQNKKQTGLTPSKCAKASTSAELYITASGLVVELAPSVRLPGRCVIDEMGAWLSRPSGLPSPTLRHWEWLTSLWHRQNSPLWGQKDWWHCVVLIETRKEGWGMERLALRWWCEVFHLRHMFRIW